MAIRLLVGALTTARELQRSDSVTRKPMGMDAPSAEVTLSLADGSEVAFAGVPVGQPADPMYDFDYTAFAGDVLIGATAIGLTEHYIINLY